MKPAVMHANIMAAVLLLAVSGAALAQAPNMSVPTAHAPVGPVKPGAVRVTTRAPEPDKWAVMNGPGRRIFKCKPLACADQDTVSFFFSKSPTSKPDPKALQKYANVDLPKTMRATAAARTVLQQVPQRVDTLTAKTDTLKGFPAVLNETRYSFGKTSAFIDTAIIFAGPVMIRVASVSPDRDLAKSSLDAFVGAMTIVQGPPPTHPGPAPVKPANENMSL